jgi:hypothetical protein
MEEMTVEEWLRATGPMSLRELARLLEEAKDVAPDMGARRGASRRKTAAVGSTAWSSVRTPSSSSIRRTSRTTSV